MKCTGSISRGETAEKHNTRVCYRDEEHTPENIDFARRDQNVVLVNQPIEEVYHTAFGAALEAYNAKQVARGHAERQIPDYVQKVKADKKKNLFYEFVVQLGNVDEHPDPAVSQMVYEDFLDRFRARYGDNFVVKQAVVHNDEAVSHMHLEVVPTAVSSRGLAIQNSLNKAVTQAGHADYKDMLRGWDEILTGAMEDHGLERCEGDRERQMGGVDIHTYKRTKAALETSESRLGCLRQAEEAARSDIASLDRSIGQASAFLFEAERCVTPGAVEARAAELESANQQLRARVQHLEGERERLEKRVGIAEQGVRGLRARVRGLRARLELVRAAVARFVGEVLEAAQRFGVTQLVGQPYGLRTDEIPDLFRGAAAEGFGPEYLPPPLTSYEVARQATEGTRDTRAVHPRARGGIDR